MNENEKEIIKEIDRYLRGNLSQKEIDELWVRFLKNPEYYRWFETELHLKKMAKDTGSGKIHKLDNKTGTVSVLKTYKKWAWAAAAAVVISIGFQFFSMDGTDSIYNYSIDRIENTELIGADIFRSDDIEASSLDVAINQGLAYVYNNEEDRAIDKFREVLSMDPTGLQRARVEVNLGILFYNKGEYDSAALHFRSVTELEEATRFIEEKAWWFLGNAYLNLRQLSEAREAVFNAYTLDGRYQNPALTLLKKLDLELGIIPAEPDNGI